MPILLQGFGAGVMLEATDVGRALEARVKFVAISRFEV